MKFAPIFLHEICFQTSIHLVILYCKAFYKYKKIVLEFKKKCRVICRAKKVIITIRIYKQRKKKGKTKAHIANKNTLC